ncbi:MAG: VOC family protein [Acidobacteriota bacterium]|nr:VOC family protein [Acidobacteriota bacterium]
MYVTVVVRENDGAIAFYTQKLDFILFEDTPVPRQKKRGAVVPLPGPGKMSVFENLYGNRWDLLSRPPDAAHSRECALSN